MVRRAISDLLTLSFISVSNILEHLSKEYILNFTAPWCNDSVINDVQIVS